MAEKAERPRGREAGDFYATTLSYQGISMSVKGRNRSAGMRRSEQQVSTVSISKAVIPLSANLGRWAGPDAMSGLG